MSAAENIPPKAASQKSGKPLNAPPQRPSLRKPPPRPDAAAPSDTKPQPAPAAPESKPDPVVAPASTLEPSEPAPAPQKSANHPISPPSEPMQYRAIGLVRGVYQPVEEQLNRGTIVAEDGSHIDAVLLGRVTSLIKKHIDLEAAHLWVVYPRTRQATEDSEEHPEDSSLHLQVVGIWEPDTLGLPGENPKTIATAGDIDEADVDTDEADIDTTDSEPEVDSSDVTAAAAEVPSENYFSIRGEVLNYDEDTETILVKIVQTTKRSNKALKAFKVHIFGAISGKTLGYFWEFDVERQGEKLMMMDGHPIRMVPPKKRKKGRGAGYPRRSRQENGGDRPTRPIRNTDKPRIKPPAPVKSNPL
ncbi:MAG: hypothetical protein AAF827_08380 [Cyanobacteria bacterium P01_D01_bin.6]